jgi:hypothetical protein
MVSDLIPRPGVSWALHSNGSIALERSDRGDVANEVIAKSITELTQAGERNPDLLCEAALSRLREQHG